MGNDIENDIGVLYDDEVKSAISIDPRLPHIFSLIVLLGVQRWVVKFPARNAICL
jgi:hypothetical protein